MAQLCNIIPNLIITGESVGGRSARLKILLEDLFDDHRQVRGGGEELVLRLVIKRDQDFLHRVADADDHVLADVGRQEVTASHVQLPQAQGQHLHHLLHGDERDEHMVPLRRVVAMSFPDAVRQSDKSNHLYNSSAQ